MWEIAICESDPLFAEELADEIYNFYNERDFKVQITIYGEGARLLEEMEHPKDVVFLNTRLSDAPGFGVAAFLRINNEVDHPLLVFISSKKEDMQAAFEYRPVDFIRMKSWRKDLERAVDRLWVWEHRTKYIQLGTKTRNTLVRTADIQYFESHGHYLTVYFNDKESRFQEYRFRGNLWEYEKELKKQYFVRTSKSFLVNCAFADSLEDKVIMRNGRKIPCSRNRKDDVGKMLERYANEMLRRL